MVYVHHGSEVKLGRSWCFRWLCQNGYVSRCRTNKKSTKPAAAAAAISKFVWFQEKIVYAKTQIRPKYRFNVDQVPLAADYQSRKTYISQNTAK